MYASSFISKFWPSDMCDRVRALEAQGNLNEEAVEVFNKGMKLDFCIAFVLIGFFIYAAPNWFVFFGILGILSWGYLIYQQKYKNCMKPYLLGELQQAEVSTYKQGRPFEITTGMPKRKRQYVEYRLFDSATLSYGNGASGKIVIGSDPYIKWEHLPEIGDIIQVFHNPVNPMRSMPDIGYLKKVYSLRKDIL